MRVGVEAAAQAIRRGEIVAFPTETVYGLGADVFNEAAVARVYEAKERPTFDPLIVHVASLDAAQNLVLDFPQAALVLAERFWPGPLTLVLEKHSQVPDLVTAGEATVALRVPKHPLALELIRRAGTPIAAPSANRFGRLSPTTAEHVEEQLADRVPFVLDGGPCPVGVESTILAFGPDGPLLLRPGGTPLEAIEAEIGPVGLPREGSLSSVAPGRLPSHYAPRTALYLSPERPPATARRVGRLCFMGLAPGEPEPAERQVLSESGDLAQAAARLFAALRALDQAGLDAIVADPVPDVGLGRAINDRLRRGAYRVANDPMK